MSAWRRRVDLREVRNAPRRFDLLAGEAERKAIARELDLAGLGSLEAELEATAWLDGLRITGTLKAQVTYVCGVSLEPFDAVVEDEIAVRMVAADSPHAPQEEVEVVLDLDGEDPPELLDDTGAVDLSDLVIEHLALSLDPFPRKPGAVFQQLEDSQPASPFAVLRSLKGES